MLIQSKKKLHSFGWNFLSYVVQKNLTPFCQSNYAGLTEGGIQNVFLIILDRID